MLATKGDRLTSGELVERFGVDHVYLFRWHERGWLRGEWATQAQGPGGRILWERWAERAVPFLLAEQPGACTAGVGWLVRRAQMEALALALRARPDALHFVWDGEVMVPADSDEEAAALLRALADPVATLVSPPLPES